MKNRNNSITGPQNRSPFRARGGSYAVKAKGNDAVDVFLYDEIGYWGISAEQFNKDLAAIDAKTINLRINSPGGDVFQGASIVNALQRHKATVNTFVDGLAASMASMIAISGDNVYMADNAFMMIHNPWTFAMGDANEMRKQAALLDNIGGVMAKAYADKTGKTVADMQALMDDETWFNADEALESGLIDGIDNGAADTAAKAVFDLSVFSCVPEKLKNLSGATPAKRSLEELLRDAGYSQKEAKKIVSSAYSLPSQRDADSAELCGAIDATIAKIRSHAA